MTNKNKYIDKYKTYTGKLIYTDDAEYELHSPEGTTNLSKMLNKVYYNSISNHINIKIMDKTKTLFNEDGNLYLKVVAKPDFTSLFVNGVDLGEALFNAVDKDLEITICAEALDEASGGIDYGTVDKNESEAKK